MSEPARRASRAAALLALLLLGGCARQNPAKLPEPVRFRNEVRRMLDREPQSYGFYDDWSRLGSMGPGLDTVLVALVHDPKASGRVRANALMLLAEREAPGALPVLTDALKSAKRPAVRSGAVFGLQRLVTNSPAARTAIRSALTDRDQQVRIDALQALDLSDAPAVYRLLAHERDRRVRAVAEQVLALAESRGVPLPEDSLGGYATLRLRGQPRILFRPTERDSAAGRAEGELWVQMANGRRILLAHGVEVVRGVVPAFFAPDHSAMVFEVGGDILLWQLRGANEPRRIGRGIAPRPIPLSREFVFLRETAPPADSAGGKRLRYEVLRSDFGGAEPQPLGTLTALATPSRAGGASPVRWMVVNDVPEGFVLAGEGVTTFALPNPLLHVPSGLSPRPATPR
jgi:hypothetical protein